MISKSFTVMGTLMVLSATAHAGSAPKELYGKSISITWTEQHNQRFTGDANYRNVLVPLSNSIYISATGRVFTRTIVGTWAPHEAVGTGGTSPGGGPRQIQFSGRTMTWTGASTGGVGRRITIDFNEGFSTCQAHVIVAKQAGSDVVVGIAAEIRSATVASGPNCSVRDGNVFAQ